MKTFFAFLLQDHIRYSQRSQSVVRNILFFPGCRFMFTLRACQYFSKFNPLGMIFRVWNKNLQAKYGLQIFHSCKIGKGLFIVHYNNIVVNNKSIIGENCNIHQGVTIGNVNRGKKTGCPTIGDRVWIGANAVVVGKITIGNDVLIAPLSYVTFDVPDNAVVMGNPAQIVSYNTSANYIKKIS